MVEEIFVPPLRHISPSIKICYTIDRTLKNDTDANFKVIIIILVQCQFVTNCKIKHIMNVEVFRQSFNVYAIEGLPHSSLYVLSIPHFQGFSTNRKFFYRGLNSFD